MAVRGVALFVAFAFASAPYGAVAGERRSRADSNCCRWSRRALRPPARPPRRAAAGLREAVRRLSSFPFPRPPGRTRTRRPPVARCVPRRASHSISCPANSDRIEDAANARGETYSALPAAFRYRSAGAPACGCRRAGEPGLAYWRDPTLKSGDAVMTADGIVVFRGAAGGAPYGAEAFTPVDSAPLGATRRAEFGALTPAIAPDAPKTTLRRSAKRGARPARRRARSGFSRPRPAAAADRGVSSRAAKVLTRARRLGRPFVRPAGKRALAAREARSDKRGCVAA